MNTSIGQAVADAIHSIEAHSAFALLHVDSAQAVHGTRPKVAFAIMQERIYLVLGQAVPGSELVDVAVGPQPAQPDSGTRPQCAISILCDTQHIDESDSD